MERENLIVELDAASTPAEAVDLVRKLIPYVGGFKIGLRFITSLLVQLVSAKSDGEANFRLKKIRALFSLLEEKVFLDDGFNDIPNTARGTLDVLGILNMQAANRHTPGDNTKVVVGRPVTGAADPVKAVKQLLEEGATAPEQKAVRV